MSEIPRAIESDARPYNGALLEINPNTYLPEKRVGTWLHALPNGVPKASCSADGIEFGPTPSKDNDGAMNPTKDNSDLSRKSFSKQSDPDTKPNSARGEQPPETIHEDRQRYREREEEYFREYERQRDHKRADEDRRAELERKQKEAFEELIREWKRANYFRRNQEK